MTLSPLPPGDFTTPRAGSWWFARVRWRTQGGKSDFLLSVADAHGCRSNVLGMRPPRPFGGFTLQAEVQYLPANG